MSDQAEVSAKVLDFTDYPRPEGDDPESFQAWLTAMQIADTLDQVDRYRRAHANARPYKKHGGYGEPLPDSFVIVTMEGPNRTASHFHNLRYRLTPVGEHETLVEVWDYKRFDT
ncbi:MAG: hypothetical protein JXA69_17285 [Phycisphaerae bacterium]|nr:hypothetical protein [Phycisphaerae bacterium]